MENKILFRTFYSTEEQNDVVVLMNDFRPLAILSQENLCITVLDTDKLTSYTEDEMKEVKKLLDYYSEYDVVEMTRNELARYYFRIIA